MDRHESFAEFWPFYLREHRQARTRALHYLGTSLVVGVALIAVVLGSWWLLLAMPLAGYGFAWFAHAKVEHNRPATFIHPIWSLIADFRMWWLWLTGGIERELRRAGIGDEAAASGRGGAQ